jgi:hypothetical protein
VSAEVVWCERCREAERDDPLSFIPCDDCRQAVKAMNERTAEEHRQRQRSEPSTNGQEPTKVERVAVTWLSDIKMRRVRWCWRDRLPTGAIALLAGPVGLGKSTVAVTIGADLTRGRLPGEHFGHAKRVLVAATEDSFEHTIKPRFHGAGADLSRVGRVDVQTPEGLTLPLSLPADLGGLEATVNEAEAVLLILDPLLSRLDARLDSHKDAEVRKALEPLVAVADRTDLAVLGLIHHNRSGSTDPLRLTMASEAFPAVARSVHTVIWDPDDETRQRRIFGTSKNNLGRLGLPCLPFVIERHTYMPEDDDTEPGETGKLVWQDQLGTTIEELLARARHAGRVGALELATTWLGQYMETHGPRVAAIVALTEGQAAGHAERTLQRARKELGLVKRKQGFGRGAWSWELPDQAVSEDDL